MTSRVDLKKLFRVGARPTDKDFGELIDSALIMDDEGFHKTPADGLKIDALGDSGALLSLQWSDPQIPGWSFEFADKTCGELVLRRASARGGGAAPAAGESGADATAPDSPFPLKLQDSAPRGAGGESGRLVVDGEPAPTLRLGTTAQATVLEVDGAVRASGRAGSQALVPADGKFHEITGDLRGCTASRSTPTIRASGAISFSSSGGASAAITPSTRDGAIACSSGGLRRPTANLPRKPTAPMRATCCRSAVVRVTPRPARRARPRPRLRSARPSVSSGSTRK